LLLNQISSDDLSAPGECRDQSLGFVLQVVSLRAGELIELNSMVLELKDRKRLQAHALQCSKHLLLVNLGEEVELSI
jgi:hypothetical protein